MVGVAGQEVVFIRTPEGRMAAELRGPREAQPVVVCLHGLSANRATWRPLVERLAHRRRFLLVDSLGRGESDSSPRARYDLDSEANRLLLVLDSMDVARPVLVGHSHGAAIAVAAARRAHALGLLLVNPVTPDLPRPVALTALRSPAVQALVSPAVRLFRRPLTRYMLVRRVFADRRAIPAGVVARYADPWGDPGRAAGLPAILSDWSPAELGQWDGPQGVPVHIVAGAQDRRIHPDSARRWADRLGATFELVAGCGHSAPEERTAEVAASLDKLLRAISKETGRDQDDQERPVDSTSGA